MNGVWDFRRAGRAAAKISLGVGIVAGMLVVGIQAEAAEPASSSTSASSGYDTTGAYLRSVQERGQGLQHQIQAEAQAQGYRPVPPPYVFSYRIGAPPIYFSLGSGPLAVQLERRAYRGRWDLWPMPPAAVYAYPAPYPYSPYGYPGYAAGRPGVGELGATPGATEHTVAKPPMADVPEADAAPSLPEAIPTPSSAGTGATAVPPPPAPMKSARSPATSAPPASSAATPTATPAGRAEPALSAPPESTTKPDSEPSGPTLF